MVTKDQEKKSWRETIDMSDYLEIVWDWLDGTDDRLYDEEGDLLNRVNDERGAVEVLKRRIRRDAIEAGVELR